MLRIVGLIVIVFSMMVGIGSNLPSMIDLPSIIIVVGATLGMLIFGGSSIPTMVKAVFSSDASEDDIRTAIKG